MNDEGAEILFMKRQGLGLAVGLEATVVRMQLVPATMCLLGLVVSHSTRQDARGDGLDES